MPQQYGVTVGSLNCRASGAKKTCKDRALSQKRLGNLGSVQIVSPHTITTITNTHQLALSLSLSHHLTTSPSPYVWKYIAHTRVTLPRTKYFGIFNEHAQQPGKSGR